MLSIIACGNPLRSDDGLGHHVFEALQADPVCTASEAVRLFDAGTDGVAVMYQARGSDALILIDACQSGETPGAVFEVPGAEFDDRPPEGQNLHAFRWDHALYAGRRIYADEFPEAVTVLLVEAECLETGLTLSAPVAEAAGQVVARIREIVTDYLARRQADTVRLEGGSVYLPAGLCTQHLSGAECVAPLIDEALLLLPLQNETGGYLLKQRNAAGDRVVELQGFFRDQGWNDMPACDCTVSWDSQRAALRIALPDSPLVEAHDASLAV